MSVNLTVAKTETDFRGRSGAVWALCQWDDQPDSGSVKFHDDFTNYLTSKTQYLEWLDTNSTIAQVASVEYGAVVMTPAATDNKSVGLQVGAGAGTIKVEDGIRPFYFEARVKVSGTTEIGIAVGICEEAANADNFLADDTGALADKDFIGFHIGMGASAESLNAVYKKAGQTAVTAASAVHDIVADTYVKLGLRYHPNTNLLEWLVNGVSVAELAATSWGSTFPLDQILGPIAYVKNGSSTARTMTIDWIDCHQSND